MRACTGLVFVMEPNAGGAKVEAEKLWQEAEQQRLPRLAFVSKMDRDHADFDGALKDIQEILQGKPVPLQIPIGSAKTFRGVVDLLRMKALIAKPDGSLSEEDVPADLQEAAKEAHERLMESAAEVDDDLVEQYLEPATDAGQLRDALPRGIRECRFIPVLCGSGQQNLAVRPLLDAIVELLPSPAELPPVIGEDPKTGKDTTREPKVDAPFSAFVFKTIVDNFAGKLEVFRVMSGQLHGDAAVLNVNKDAKERIGHILRIEGRSKKACKW
jgi:elongation factor G